MDFHRFSQFSDDFQGLSGIFIDFHGFHGFGDSGFEALWEPVAPLRVQLLPLMEDGRLQSCRLGG